MFFTYVLLGVYLFGLIFSLGAGIATEMDFVNPEYGFVVLASLVWPFVVLQIIVAWQFDFYFGKWVRRKRTAYRQWRCDHEGVADDASWCPNCKYEFGDN